MDSNKPTATPTSKIRVQRESAEDGDAADGGLGDLPFHLTEKILLCISPLESARLAAVCRSWAATISGRLRRPTPHLFALKGRRGAIFSVPAYGDGEDSPSPALAVRARLPSTVSHLNYSHLCGASPNGNLSIASKDLVTLVNPITGAFRNVEISDNMYRSGPKFCTGAEAFFVTEFYSCVSLWWCTEEWFEQKLPLPEDFKKTGKNIELGAYHDGVFFAMELSGLTYTVDTRVPPPWRLTRLHLPSILEQYSPIHGYRNVINTHLVQSEGHVLFVGPVLAPQEPKRPKSMVGFEVYMLDVEGARWVKVERLASDLALFVSEHSSFAVHASEMPGCMSNCIYFVSEVDVYSAITWGIYSMEEEKILFQRPVGGSPGKFSAARWFLPHVVSPFTCLRWSLIRCMDERRKICIL